MQNEQRVKQALVIGILILIAVYFLFFTARYSTGISYCGKGVVSTQVLGFLKRASQISTVTIDAKCPPGISGGLGGSFMNTFIGVSAIAWMEGEGTIRVYVEKNGVMCDEKIVSGKGKFTAKATCH
jgi:hypothetical protein